ncbi:MAG: hypothetical protein V7603_5118 [Micromonosporaceae bacterium]
MDIPHNPTATERRPATPADLTALLAAPTPPRPPWADARHYAGAHLGDDLANLIIWQPAAEWIYGTLRAGDAALRLRFDQPEPAAELLQVQVTCPADPACPHAWDTVESRADLAAAFAGGLAASEPGCDAHPDVRWPDE